MKLVRYGAIGHEKPGLIDDSGQLRDLSGQVKDFAGDAFSPANLATLSQLDTSALPVIDGHQRLGSPVGGSPKFIAIGLNYADHAAESGMPIPSEPIVFIKANNSLCGPNVVMSVEKRSAISSRAASQETRSKDPELLGPLRRTG